MSVNLSKNKAEILTAWKDVLDEKTTTDWALFGYEGLSNNLMVVSKGDGGIDEMKDDLNSGTIMYAFCKVIDPKTSLRKYVLINWQGEGAPLIRKGVCANHVRDVANTLKGFHVTLNARTEEDVDSDLIIEKVEKSASSSYSFDERLDLSKDGYQKVDPAYKKVEPRKEINPAERDKFWAEDEEQEKQRQQEELRRKQEEQLRLEKEQMEREAAEASKREQIIIESSTSSNRNNIMDDIRRISELRKTGNNIISEQNSAKSEELRKLRNKETEELISKRTINARAIFEQNTSFGQLINKKQITNIAKTKNDNALPIKEINKDLNQDVADIYRSDETSNETPVFVSNNAVKVDDRFKVLNNFTPAVAAVPVAVDVKNGDNNAITSDTSVPVVAVNENLNGQSEMVSVTHEIYQQGDYNIQAEALYDYQAADETEISFDPGDIITHIEQIDPGWWQGLAPDGSYGLFPANYVQLL